MNTNIYFRGDVRRGEEIIRILEREGGRNEQGVCATVPKYIYFIDATGVIDSCASDSELGREVRAHRTEAKLNDPADMPCPFLRRLLSPMPAEPKCPLSKNVQWRSPEAGYDLVPDSKQTKKREFAIGEIFQYGLHRLQVKEQNGCENCYFWRSIGCVDRGQGNCETHDRQDGKSVIFVKVE